jgi:hypothetical protein
MHVVDRARGQLPPFIDAYLPASAAEFRGHRRVDEQAPERLATGGQGRGAHVRDLLIGMVLGAIIALQRVRI